MVCVATFIFLELRTVNPMPASEDHSGETHKTAYPLASDCFVVVCLTAFSLQKPR
jgi:hypothetical protein